jgi:hypothetical protein
LRKTLVPNACKRGEDRCGPLTGRSQARLAIAEARLQSQAHLMDSRRGPGPGESFTELQRKIDQVEAGAGRGPGELPPLKDLAKAAQLDKRLGGEVKAKSGPGNRQ